MQSMWELRGCLLYDLMSDMKGCLKQFLYWIPKVGRLKLCIIFNSMMYQTVWVHYIRLNSLRSLAAKSHL